MTTLESPRVAELWKAIHHNEPEAKFGGSVGDAAHARESHTYHMSWEDQVHDNGYSVCYDSDKKRIPKSSMEYASAIDITLPTDLMKKYTARLHHWSQLPRKTRDNMMFGIMEFAGTLDGENVYAIDTHGDHSFRTYGWDSSHLWHIHLSIARRHINNPAILRVAKIFA